MPDKFTFLLIDNFHGFCRVYFHGNSIKNEIFLKINPVVLPMLFYCLSILVVARAIRDVQINTPNMLNCLRFDLITITSIQENHWYGELNEQRGWLFQSDVEKVTNAFGVVNHADADDHFDEYGIKNGDIVTITNPYHQDWWEVQFSNKKVLYPSVFITIVDSFRIEGMADFDYEGISSEELSFKDGDVISKITYQLGHDWLRGELKNGKSGIFPRNYLTFTLKPIIKAKVTAEYSALESDELNLVIGSEIDVVEDLGNGWMKGICGNNHGTFPGSFVEILDEQEEEKEALAENPVDDSIPGMDIIIK